MPDIKEKLVELMELNIDYGLADILADHLIANGVTIQKWISVEERLPERHKDVLVHYENGKIGLEMLMSWGAFTLERLHGKATHWMPLPEPPKEEV